MRDLFVTADYGIKAADPTDGIISLKQPVISIVEQNNVKLSHLNE